MKLFLAALELQQPGTRIAFEPGGIDLLAKCVKESR